jgi:threonine dehydrogenase-like Zn-dependent dehydrogenase
MTMMRAAVFAEPQRVRVEEVALPDPGPGQVRVRLEGCGVCASNLAPWEGHPWFTYPLDPGAPGHEGWGRVDAAGAGVRGIREGDRVAVLSSRAYAEYDVAPAAATVPIPETLAGQPFPGEALGCAMNIVRRSEIAPGHTVAVVGIGFLGALVTRLAAHAGARVIAVSRRAFALDLARGFGAAETVVMDDHARILEEVRDLTGGEGCDRVVEAVGKQWPLDLAAELTRVRGRLVIAGYHQDGPRQVNMQLWNWRGLDVVNAHEREEAVALAGIRAALDAMAEGWLDPRPLYTHRYLLDGLGEAMRAAAERPHGFLKALVSA